VSFEEETKREYLSTSVLEGSCLQRVGCFLRQILLDGRQVSEHTYYRQALAQVSGPASHTIHDQHDNKYITVLEELLYTIRVTALDVRGHLRSVLVWAVSTAN
jgi:hypothetical protein